MKALIYFCLLSVNLVAQQRFSLYLIGDAGNDTLPNKTLRVLQQHLEQNPNSIVLFLGDNIYPRGLDGSPEAQKKLEAQLSVLQNYTGEWIFIPGNHDWAKGRWKGYKNVIRQQQFLAEYASKKMPTRTYQYEHFYPKEGLPGPSVIELENAVLLITDTDWWLHRQFFHKVGKTGSLHQMQRQFLQKLDSALAMAKTKGKLPVFLSHHPLVNFGKHAQPNQPWRALINYTPLQIFGVLGLNRALVCENPQPRYKRMANAIKTVLQKYEPYVAVSGHEHDFQYIQQGKATYLISGSGSKLTEIPTKAFKKPELLFGKSVHGFMELQIDPNGKTNVIVWDENNQELYKKND